MFLSSHVLFFAFSLSPGIGEIINWVALDREQQTQHTLKVMVTDQGHPRLNATATVHIMVTDINDNPPQFTHLPSGKELNLQVRKVSLLCFPMACSLFGHIISGIYRTLFIAFFFLIFVFTTFCLFIVPFHSSSKL